MPVREIDINEMAMKVFDKAAELLPQTSTNFANMLVTKAQEVWILSAKTIPTNKDGKSSLWGQRYASTIKTQYMSGKSGGIAKVFVDDESKNYRFVEYIEQGVDSWSISDALMKGKAARRNQALYGRAFVNVPFRYRIPGTMKPTSGAFVGIMPIDVYEKAKSGEKIGKEYGNLTGLTRMSEGVHSQYMTFRTVTAESDWVYPRKEAQPVFDIVQKKVEKMIQGTIINFIQGFMKDLQKESMK